MLSWLIPVIIGAVVLGCLLVFILTRKKKEPSLAQRLGLADQGGVLRGQVQGFAVILEIQSRGGARSRSVLKIEFPQRLGLGLKIMKPIGGKPSLRALATGDSGFDQTVNFEAQEKKKALEFMTPERRQRVQTMLAAEPDAWMDDVGITCTKQGAPDESIKKTIDDLVDAAIDLFPGRSARKKVREAEKKRGQDTR
jgi:hypothetical protein